MPNSSEATLDRSLARPAPGQDQASGRRDAEDAAKERLLTDLFDKPFGPTPERMQVIKERDGSSAKPREKTVDEVSEDNKAKAEKRLADAHKALSFTTNNLEPKVLSFRTNVAVAAETTPLAVAKEELGDKADPKQLEAYAAALMKANEITGKADEAKIAAGTRISLPGQRADGGVVTRANGVTTTEWHDGSTMTVSERGVGEASFKEADGSEIKLSWGPDSLDQNYSERVKDNRKWETANGGQQVEYVRENAAAEFKMVRQTLTDEKGRKVEAEYDAGARAPKLIRVTDPKDHSTMELRPDAPGTFKGEKKNEKGEVVDTDVRMRIDRRGITIWSQKENDDKTVTKTYENGMVENLDAAGKMIKREGKDEWGRKVVEDYEKGHGLPFKITVTMKDGKDIEFNRKPFGQYQADYKNEKGERVGVIDLRANGLILFENEKEQKARAELPDGTQIERTHFGNGRQEIRQTKDGETLVKALDREGSVVQAEYTTKDGRKITRRNSSDGSAVESITIEDKNGSKTDIKYNRDIGLFSGARTDKSGKEVERVHYMAGKLVYTDVNNGSTRFEKLKVFERDLFNLKMTSGKYDAGTGSITYRNADGSRTVESFAPGRVDVIKDGTTRGTTSTGIRSSVLASGEASVHHPDDTGVRLNPNMTIDRWGPEREDNGQGEALTRVEGAYVRNHPDVDRRAVAEIHRQFHNKPEVLDKFYAALSEIDSAKNLSKKEQADLRRGLMHHVAYPAELYQGNSWCCNVAVIEREMAMNMPDRYVQTVTKALSDGELTLANGDKISLKDCNLREPDSTGRDMPTRVFHTLALHAKYQPKYTFRNTPDGAGRLVPRDGEAQQASFNGLDMDDIVDARYKLTGEKKAVVSVTTVDDLVTAWEANGSRSMIIAVNADQPPFTENMAAMFGGPTASRPNHVVNISRIDAGPPAMVYMQNQWGLSEDHSTPARAVEASVILNAMKGRVPGRTGGLVETPGQLIAPGEPGKTYFYKDGKAVEEKRRG